MKSAGIQIYNNNNVLQITAEFKNVQFIEKQSYSLTYDGVALGGIRNRYISPEIVVPGDEYTIVAFNTTPGHSIGIELLPIIMPGTTKQRLQFVSFESDTIVTIYIFRFTDIKKGTFFEIYDTNGEIVFSDGANFMRIIDTKSGEMSIDVPVIWPDINVYTISDDRTMAIVASQILRLRESHPDEMQHYDYCAQTFFFQQNAISSKICTIENGGIGEAIVTVYCNRYDNLIIDVTGL